MGCTFALFISADMLQVNGLPTNRDFLRRIARHPSFVSADLDTSFIEKHKDSLLAPQAVPQRVAALAAVANHLLDVQQVSVDPGGRFRSSVGRDTLHEIQQPCRVLLGVACLLHLTNCISQHVLWSQACLCSEDAAALVPWGDLDSLGTLRGH